MSDSRQLPGPEELRALKERGIVFTSPLATRLAVIAALLVGGVVAARAADGFVLPADTAGARQLGMHVLTVAALASAASAVTALSVALALNGFFLSAALLSPRRGGSFGFSAVAWFVQAGLGVALGTAVLYGSSKALFGALYADAGGPAQHPALLAYLKASLKGPFTAVIVGTVILAILVAGAARARFLFRNRAVKSSLTGGH